MKVALVTLQGVIGSYGGTARVFFNMANNLVARGFSVTAIASDPRPGKPAFNVDEKVTFVNCVSSCFSRYVLEPSTKFISAFTFNRQRRRTLRQVLDLQIKAKKKDREIDREVNTPLFMLRCVQLGISISDLDLLSIGLINDMFIELKNDEYKYPVLATQDDIDRL